MYLPSLFSHYYASKGQRNNITARNFFSASCNPPPSPTSLSPSCMKQIYLKNVEYNIVQYCGGGKGGGGGT